MLPMGNEFKSPMMTPDPPPPPPAKKKRRTSNAATVTNHAPQPPPPSPQDLLPPPLTGKLLIHYLSCSNFLKYSKSYKYYSSITFDI